MRTISLILAATMLILATVGWMIASTSTRGSTVKPEYPLHHGSTAVGARYDAVPLHASP